MKKLMFILMLLIASISTKAQLDVVWQKTFPEQIQFAKFSPDGKVLYCNIGDSIVVMDPLTGERLRRFEGTKPYPFYDLSISNSGNYLISGFNGGIAIWDVKTEKYLKEFGGGILKIFISNDDKYMYSMYADGNIKIVDMLTEKVIKQVQMLKIQNAEISNNGQMIAIGYPYKKWNPNGGFFDYVKLELWDAEKLQLIKVLQDTLGTDGYRSFSFSKDDKYFAALISGSYANTIYNLNEDSITEILTPTIGNEILNFKFVNDNSKLYFKMPNQLEYKNNNNQLYTYNSYDKVMETIGEKFEWYVLLGSRKKFTLFKNAITSVNYESEIPYLIVNYSLNGLLRVKCSYDVEPPIEIVIYDLDGKTIYQTNEAELNSTNEMIFNINLKNGTYLIKAKTKNKIYTQKFQVLR